MTYPLSVFRLVQTSEHIIPICNLKVKNVTITVFITLKAVDKPKIAYVNTQWFRYEHVSDIDVPTFLILYALGWYNTQSSDLSNMKGIETVLSYSHDIVICRLNTYLDGSENVRAIAFLKELFHLGFRTLSVVTKLDALLEKESVMRLRNKKAATIQRFFREAIANPTHTLCVKRLMHEWEDMLKSMLTT